MPSKNVFENKYLRMYCLYLSQGCSIESLKITFIFHCKFRSNFNLNQSATLVKQFCHMNLLRNYIHFELKVHSILKTSRTCSCNIVIKQKMVIMFMNCLRLTALDISDCFRLRLSLIKGYTYNMFIYSVKPKCLVLDLYLIFCVKDKNHFYFC